MHITVINSIVKYKGELIINIINVILDALIMVNDIMNLISCDPNYNYL